MLYAVSNFVNAQTPRKFVRRDIVDVGNGQKVEIIQCHGEGPLEECDVIYYTTNRGQGTRMWQNANRLREDERAARLLRDIEQGKINSLAKNPVSPEKASGQDESFVNTNSVKSNFLKQQGALTSHISDLSVPATTQSQIDKDAALQKEIRRIDSITKSKVDTFKLALQREIEIQDSIANAGVLVDTAAIQEVRHNELKENLGAASANPDVPVSPSPGVPQGIDKNETTSLTDSRTANSTPQQNPLKEIPGSRSAAEQDLPRIDQPVGLKDNKRNNLPLREISETAKPAPATTLNNSKSSAKKEASPAKSPADTAAEIKASPTEVNKSIEVAVKNTAADKPIVLSGKKETAPLASPKESAVETIERSNNANMKTRSDSVDTSIAAATASPSTSSGSAKVNIQEKLPVKTAVETALKTQSKQDDATDLYTRTAEVKNNGSWQKVTIIDKESEYLYKVHYNGKSASEDEWVAVSQIRNIDSALRREVPANEVEANNTNNNSSNCSFSAPAPPVSDADKFSAKLAKRKIYESYVEEMKNKNSAAKIGLTFLSFAAEKPFINTVSVSETESLVFKYPAAPAGAMVYPVSAKYIVCEQVAKQTTSTTVNSNYGCYRNKNGIWTCTTR